LAEHRVPEPRRAPASGDLHDSPYRVPCLDGIRDRGLHLLRGSATVDLENPAPDSDPLLFQDLCRDRTRRNADDRPPARAPPATPVVPDAVFPPPRIIRMPGPEHLPERPIVPGP